MRGEEGEGRKKKAKNEHNSKVRRYQIKSSLLREANAIKPNRSNT